AGGGVGAGVGQDDGEGDGVADVRRRVIDGLGEGEVGLLRRFGGAGLVVARVGVELVGGRDRRHVGPRRRARHGGGQHQRRRQAGGDCADGPQAGRRVVGADAGGGADQRQAGRQQVVDVDVGGGVGTLV